jgi:uncharacterized protein (DUF924 family)
VTAIDRRMALPAAGDVLAFWRALGADRWFRKDAAVDAEIRDRFGDLHALAAEGELGAWESDAPGALALVITLDQFPRNMYRGSANAFATDPLARAAAKRAIEHGFDRAVAERERVFFYMPLMHSETLADQERCLGLCRALDAGTMKYAELHADIIRRFGRFPHRNAVLGRVTTAEEQAFLDRGGFSG